MKKSEKVLLGLFIILCALIAFGLTINYILVDRDSIYMDNNEQSGIIKAIYENSKKAHSGDFQVDSSKYEFLTNVLGGIGVGQNCLNADFKVKEQASIIMKSCIRKAMAPESVFFDSFAWDESPLDAIDSTNHHLAYLGYFNALLSMNRYIELNAGKGPDGKSIEVNPEYTRLNDRITKKLIKAFVNSDCGMLQTYPSQAITTDNAAAIGSIGLYYKAYGKEYPDTFLQIIGRFKNLAIDKKTNLLNYYIDYKTGEADGTLRGSGTAVGMYFIAFADTSIARTFYKGIIENLRDTVYGVHGIREYLRDGEDPQLGGDTDTGPIVYGIGMSSTGFTIAGSLLFRDKETYDHLTKTAWTFGMPLKNNGGMFLQGGITQNAIMFAILNTKVMKVNQIKR